MSLLGHNTARVQLTSKPVACSSLTAGKAFLLLPKIREMTPPDCLSVMGVDTGVAGTDLLAVGRLLTGVGVTPVTAVVSLSAVADVTFVNDNCRPGIGRAGGADNQTTHAIM